MFVSPKHSQFQKKMRKPKHLRSCSLISIQFLPLSCNMTPCRTEKVDFSKKKTQKTKTKTESPEKKTTGRITRRNKKTRKKQETRIRSFLCGFSCFFPCCWFSSLFFFVCFGFVFFRQTLYSLCCWARNYARFPQSILKIIASSGSLEVQACRPIKTQ